MVGGAIADWRNLATSREMRNQQAARSRGEDPTKLLPAAHHVAALVKRCLAPIRVRQQPRTWPATSMSSCSALAVGAHAAAGWCFTGCLNSPSHTILCAIETSSSHINLGDCHQHDREDGGTHQAWSVLQQAARGEPRTRPTPVKWIPRRNSLWCRIALRLSLRTRESSNRARS